MQESITIAWISVSSEYQYGEMEGIKAKTDTQKLPFDSHMNEGTGIHPHFYM